MDVPPSGIPPNNQPQHGHSRTLSPLSTPQLTNVRSQRGAFSPVNEAGSYLSDRVVMAGTILKRRKRTKTWDTVRLVLRPNLLSIYKDEEETKLRHQIQLADVTVVALRKDRKREGDHEGAFTVFTPPRNFHLKAASHLEAKAWVDTLRNEAHGGDSDKEVTIAVPSRDEVGLPGLSRTRYEKARAQAARASFEASDGGYLSSSSAGRDNVRIPVPVLRPYHEASDASGNEMGSYSDLSEPQLFGSVRDVSLNFRHEGLSGSARSGSYLNDVDELEEFPSRPPRNMNSFYQMGMINDDERIVWRGHLECLKTRGAVRQWKRYWTILRPKQLALYKTEEEYAALLILPLSTILDAVETDAMSKSRVFCMQVITDDRSYRFCCADEEELTQVLGSLKATLAKRKNGRGGIANE